MPIEVRYGEDPGALATLAMLAGMQQQKVPQAPRISIAGVGGGGGGRGGRAPQRQTTTSRPAERREPSFEEKLRLEAEYEIKREYWGQQLEEERMQLENEMKTEGWKLQYNAEARKTWQKGNDTLRKIKEGVRNGTISPEEGEAMRQTVTQQMFGAEESWEPPDPNEPKFPKGQGIGEQWTDEEGNRVTREPDGGLQVQVSFDKTRAGLQMKYEAEQEKAAGDLQRTQDEKEEASREKYDSVRSAYKAKLFDKYFDTIDDPNEALQKAEITAERLYPSLGPSRKARRQRSEFDEALEDKLKLNAQVRAAAKYGVSFTKEESEAPDDVREAILFTKAADKQYGNRRAPPDVQAELTKAAAIIREHAANQEEEARMMQEALQDAGPNPGLRGLGVEADLEYLEN